MILTIGLIQKVLLNCLTEYQSLCAVIINEFSTLCLVMEVLDLKKDKQVVSETDLLEQRYKKRRILT